MLEKQIWMGFFKLKNGGFLIFLKKYGNFPNLMALVPIPPPPKKRHKNMVFMFLN